MLYWRWTIFIRSVMWYIQVSTHRCAAADVQSLLEDVDIKADNIILDIADAKLFDDYVANELEYPTPRKFVDGNPIYMSRRFGLPREFGQPILSDFGSAVRGDIEHDEDVQPNIYRAPEVMLEVPWSYPIDIWNLGCMV